METSKPDDLYTGYQMSPTDSERVRSVLTQIENKGRLAVTGEGGNFNYMVVMN